MFLQLLISQRYLLHRQNPRLFAFLRLGVVDDELGRQNAVVVVSLELDFNRLIGTHRRFFVRADNSCNGSLVLSDLNATYARILVR